MNRSLLRRVRILLVLFTLGLIASGVTAIPLEWEIGLLQRWIGENPLVHSSWPELAGWIARVHEGVSRGYGEFPFLAYGTDWLAFGHIAIAIAFLGALRDPVKNTWVIEFGMIACLLVIPWTIAFGALRGIPWFWQVTDMSFGLVGIIPLWLARRTVLTARAGAVT